MASFFGEIVEPTTRAIFDEFSDEENNAEEPELQLSWTCDTEKLPAVFDVFFIIQGRLSLAFAERFLKSENANVIAEITVVENENPENDSIEYHKAKALPSRIYLDDGKVICLVSPSVLSELGYYFCEAILSLLRVSKKIIVCTNDSLYAYKTQCPQELPFAFIKQLNTSYGPQEYVAEPMETPNFITGVSAAVMSWCQIFNKDASAFVCYTDQEKLDSITANPYLAVLKKINPNIIKNENLNWHNKKMFYGKPEIIGGSSNLYF